MTKEDLLKLLDFWKETQETYPVYSRYIEGARDFVNFVIEQVNTLDELNRGEFANIEEVNLFFMKFKEGL